jgi:hypothetical protein
MTSTQSSAVEVLKSEHEKLLSAIRKYESAKGLSGSEKERKLADFTHLLTILSSLETGIFYSEIKDKCDGELIEKFSESHNHIKVLLAGAQRMMGEEEGFDEHLKELFAAIEKHIKEEDEKLFPALKGCELDFEAIGKRLGDSRDEMNTK